MCNVDKLSKKEVNLVLQFMQSQLSKELEPSYCKKRQKKSRARNWFGEQGTPEGSEWYQIDPTLQSLTGKYRDLQGNPCNEKRDPAMSIGVPCNENRFFTVGIGSQRVPCELYRVWVCIVNYKLLNRPK